MKSSQKEYQTRLKYHVHGLCAKFSIAALGLLGLNFLGPHHTAIEAAQ